MALPTEGAKCRAGTRVHVWPSSLFLAGPAQALAPGSGDPLYSLSG